MTENDLPFEVQAFVALVRTFGGEVAIDYERHWIGIHFDDPEDKDKFFDWVEQVVDVTEETFH
jgi:hypothetical protein